MDWELMTDMLGGSVENFVQQVKDKYPYAKPKLIHENGSQFVSHDFKRLLQRLKIEQIFTRRNHIKNHTVSNVGKDAVFHTY
jgi:transposase InsO family protein